MTVLPEHFSFSQLKRWLDCPESYRLYYLERLRPRMPSAALVFGRAMHEAIEAALTQDTSLVTQFTPTWQDQRETPMAFSGRQNWESLRHVGEGLARVFDQEVRPLIGQVHSAEQRFELTLPGVKRPLMGYVDAVVDWRGTPGARTLVEFKTSARAWQSHQFILSDQLAAYGLAFPELEQQAVVVLVKTKAPKVQVEILPRRPERASALLHKAAVVATDIAAGRFYKRPSHACGWCDYRLLCEGRPEEGMEGLERVA